MQEWMWNYGHLWAGINQCTPSIKMFKQSVCLKTPTSTGVWPSPVALTLFTVVLLKSCCSLCNLCSAKAASSYASEKLDKGSSGSVPSTAPSVTSELGATVSSCCLSFRTVSLIVSHLITQETWPTRGASGNGWNGKLKQKAETEKLKAVTEKLKTGNGCQIACSSI